MSDTATGLPKADRLAPHVTGRKRGGANLAQRMQKSIEKAKQINARSAKKIPLHINITLEAHEALVALADKYGMKVATVGSKCFLEGLTKYVTLRSKPHPFDETTFGVFDKHPPLARARTDYGEREEEERQRQQDELRERRKQAAQDLNLPGHRKPLAEAITSAEG